MSTQSVRNIVRGQLEQIISTAKIRIREEGKKKIVELKQQIPTPPELVKKLAADINVDTCSEEGVKKFNKKFKEIEDNLKFLENMCSEALNTLTNIEDKLNTVINSVQDGPIGSLNKLVDALGGPVKLLQKIIVLSALLYLANSGPTSNGAAQAQIDENKRNAESKVGEYAALFAMIPLMIAFYIDEARKVSIPLVFLKNKIQFIKDEIVKLRLFIIALELKFEGGCNALNNPTNPVNPVEPEEPTELEQYLTLLETQFNDVYQQLVQSGNTKAVARVFAIKESFEEDYNISFKIINPSLGEGSEYPGTFPSFPD